jgi:hypothetical protein
MTRMKINRWSVLCSLVLLLAACGQGDSGGGGTEVVPSKPQGPSVITFAQALDSSFIDQQVSIEGYFRLPFSIFAYERIPLDFFSRFGQRKGPHIVAQVRLLDSTDAVLPLPPSYGQDDLRILTHAGDTLDGRNRYRVTGYLRLKDVGVGKPKELQLEVDEIHLAETAAPTLESLHPLRLDSTMVADSTRRHYLVVAEGMLKVPFTMFAFQEYWLYLEGPHPDVACHFQIGYGANRIDSIAAKFKDSDVRVYDYDMRRIDLKRRVRVYGDYTGPDDLTDGEIFVEKIEQINE